jgi:hypothetical protein
MNTIMIFKSLMLFTANEGEGLSQYETLLLKHTP